MAHRRLGATGSALAMICRLVVRRDRRFQLNRELVRHFVIGRSARAIPPRFVEALVAVEDRRFYAHSGVDPIAIMRAAYAIVVRGRREGGSTVEQQLVRAITGDRSPSVRRKMREIALAEELRWHHAKDDLARAYLHVAYYGAGMNGFTDACRYLAIDARRATDRDAARVVARLRYPEPSRSDDRIRFLIARREHYVLAHLARGRCHANATDLSPLGVPSS